MTTKNKIYITVVTLAASAALLVAFVIFPLFAGIAKNAADFLGIITKIASLDAEIENVGIVKNQYQKYKPDLEKINLLFINAEVPIDFIRFLEKLAFDSKVSAVISPGSNLKSDNQDWQSFNFRLSVKGSFLNFSRFLEKLENAPYLIEVQNMNVRPEKTEGGQEINADFTIKVFANK